MTKWLDDLHNGEQKVSDVRSELRCYARALLTVGNVRLSDDLYSLAWTLEDAGDLLDAGTSKAVDEVFNGAMQGTGNMLSMTLMMCEQDGKHAKDEE